MNKLGKLERKNFFCGIELTALPCAHLVNLLKRKESEHTDTFENIVVRNISPILIELIRAGFFGIKPDGALLGLAHLLALGIEKQSNGHGIGVLAELLSDELGAAEHIAPLVIAAELHIAAVILEKAVKVIALHYHVIELKERKTLFHSLLVALGSEHIVNRKAGAYITQNIYVIKL